MSAVRRITFVLLAAALWLWGARPAMADAVDDAFARGNAHAEAGQWEEAVDAYRQAMNLLPQRNSMLSYNLGTAHAARNELGPATYHLRRALDFAGGPDAEVMEAAEHNLGVVRRQAELEATTTGAQIDRPETWWDLVLEALRAPGVGWVSLIGGWGFVMVYAFDRWRRRRGVEGSGVLGAVLVVLGVAYLVVGILHGLAIRADATSPEAIVLDAQADARDGPGNHRTVGFTLQGGARVRVVGRSPGWRQVRLPGGLEGWVPQDTIGELDATSAMGAKTGGTPRS